MDHRRVAPIQVGAFVSSLVTFTLFEAAYFARSCAPASSRSRAARWRQRRRSA
jgi:hypothetical protein